ncbi:MAG: VWA containing CoxE family protein [Oligoflexia bacterium]|nr:VWA containing CoxE family protein [Oligoflexia bacterium]
MFEVLLLNLRAQGVPVGLSEWLAFLDGLRMDLVSDLDDLYRFGRAVLVHSETQYDQWDVAFQATFAGVELEPQVSDKLRRWIEDALRDALRDAQRGGRPPGADREDVEIDPEELRRQFAERLREQKERHDGGGYWVGTGGRSPFGSGGTSAGGIRVGQGGGRSAMQVAGERRWADYRVDQQLLTRDLQVALRALRNLAREGPLELSIDKTIDATAHNAGEIELVEERARRNRVHVVLIMDTGGSMAPHARLVERLFTAASNSKDFKTFQALQFHNAPYGWLYEDYATWTRTPIPELLKEWTPAHRLVFVGDASMASHELFQPWGSGAWDGSGHSHMSGLEWMQAIRRRCPAGVWLNPDPVRYWRHPTVQAIGAVYPMFPLTLAGLRDAIRRLRAGG